MEEKSEIDYIFTSPLKMSARKGGGAEKKNATVVVGAVTQAVEIILHARILGLPPSQRQRNIRFNLHVSTVDHIRDLLKM